ncbi:MAG: metallophosphoesterase family protein, partial [Promethearchaeota archaeon]
MRLAVLADTHGNLPALNAVLQELERHQVDGYIVAGDLTGGPQANETIRLLRELDCWMIQGNSDTNLLQYVAGGAPEGWYTSLQWALLRWTARDISPDNLAFLQSLPAQRVVELANTSAIRVVHGSPRNPAEHLYPAFDPVAVNIAFRQITEPVLVCGHTHIPWKLERDYRLILNPGAVCGPLNGELGAQYAMLTWEKKRWQPTHHLVTYDLRLIRKAFQESGLLTEGGTLARAFLLSIETGRNVAGGFLSHAYKLAATMGFTGQEIIPDSVWTKAAETFNWAEIKR